MSRSWSHLLSAPRRNASFAVGAALIAAACAISSSAAQASAGKSNGLSGKSPAQILAAAQSAMASARGFVAAGAFTDSGSTLRVRIVVNDRSRFGFTIDEGQQTAEILTISGAGFLRANRAYLVANAGQKTASLANRWIELPAATSRQLASSLGPFAPNTLAQCLGEDLGTLTLDGTTTVDGTPAVVIRQAGNVPGGSPGTMAVATTGPAYPLRLTNTGRTRPGGKVDVCNDGKGGDNEGSLTLSDFDHVPAIPTPQNAVKLGSS